MYNHKLTLLFLKRGVFVYLFFLLQNSFVIAQNSAENILQNARNIIQTVIEQERFAERFLDMDAASQNAHTLPIGFHRTFGNTSFTIAISNISFGSQYGEATLYVDMPIPQKDKRLMFGATGVKISYDGDLIGDVKLSLLSDVSIPMGSMGQLIIKGGTMNKSTGTVSSSTYLSLECNGDFKELSIDADFILNPNTFVSALDKKSEVVTSFQTTIHNWNDLLVQVSFPPFEIKGADGFEFSLSEATLDLSDIRNSESFFPDPEYFGRYFTLPNHSLWRGIYVDNFKVSFPPWFKNKNSNEKVTIEANRLLIDENGITGDILGKNVLSIESGDASGWAFSVTDFQLSLIANNIKAFGFEGEIDVPISGGQQLHKYKAYVSKDKYYMSATLEESLDLRLFGDNQLKLDSSSYLNLELSKDKFVPKVVLNGSMQIDTLGLKMEEITFTKLTISSDYPEFSVEEMGYGGEIQLYNFPITVSNINFSTANKQATLDFDLKINLMQGQIAADSHLKLTSEYQGRSWDTKNLSLSKIRLDNVELAGFSLDGEIRMEKDHSVYGNYFGGDITATFDALSKDLTVQVAAVFGRKDFRYWFVEGTANFGESGVPVGPVSLNGFSGGVSYRMAATGKNGLDAYIPDERYSLGLKAGVDYFIGSSTAVNGTALFEMNFLSGGGIKDILFYGSANFMTTTHVSDRVKLLSLFKSAQGRQSDMSRSFAESVPSGQSGSEVAQMVAPEIKPSSSVSAYMLMGYDFTTQTFDANFKVMVDVLGGSLQGSGANNEAGWAHLHCSPKSWFIHIGKPRNPVGLKLGLGPLSLESQSYFMLGDQLENPIAPPPAVLSILNMTPEQADFLNNANTMTAGKGVAFGSRFDFDTGDMSFLILYARFMAGTGLDVMLQKTNKVCEGSNNTPGINGWYASGQCYAYLQGELGIRIRLLFIRKNVTVIKGGAAALLQAKLPNPTWIGGHMGVRVNVLGGLVNANMKMKFSFGDDCKLVNLDGEYSPIDMPLIADLTPADKETNVNVFLTPQVTFNLPVGKSFEMVDDRGETKYYRTTLEDFYITDNRNQRVEGTVNWNNTRDAATFKSKEILTPHVTMRVQVSVNFEELNNGRWSLVMADGKPARETRSVQFTTGEAPDHIPLSNILYCHPVVNQKNFFKGETSQGYVQLDMGQNYLFPAGFTYNAVFTTKSGSEIKTNFRYNSSRSRIEFTLPALNNNTAYTVAFVATANNQVNNAPVVTTRTSSVQDGEGESYTIEYTQLAAQRIMQNGMLSVLDYAFRSSQYNTFTQKMSAIPVEYTSTYANSDVHMLMLRTKSDYEQFDEAELIGSSFTRNTPLITVEAILDDPYFREDIAPLIYNWYPGYGITITNRNVNILGAPPVRAFNLYSGYQSYLASGTYNATYSKLLPIVYEVHFYFNKDYYELRNKAADALLRNGNAPPLQNLVNSRFLFMRQGYYKSTWKYTLPGGNTGTSKQINYYNSLDWRP
jgi:hypothetical protein